MHVSLYDCNIVVHMVQPTVQLNLLVCVCVLVCETETCCCLLLKEPMFSK